MASRPGLHLPSLFQLIISGAGFIISLSALMAFFLGLLLSLAGGDLTSPELPMLSSLMWIAALIALLLLPSVLLSGKRVLNIHSTGNQDLQNPRLPVLTGRRFGLKAASGMMALVPMLILAGESISRQASISWLLLPPVSLLVVTVPIWWIYELGSRGLERGSPQRRWGLVSVGLVITPWLVILLELILVLVISMVLVVWLSTKPGFLEDMAFISRGLTDGRADPNRLLEILTPYLKDPLVIITSLALFAGLTPMLEELLKPLGMWALMSRKPTPQEGFTAGLVCGGTFALLESLGMMASFTGEGWAVLAVGRMGTGILHSLATGLAGWGLALAWGKKDYGRLALMYLGSIALHGTWNALSIAMAVVPYLDTGASQNQFMEALPSASGIVVALLAALSVALLAGCNFFLRRQPGNVRPG